jgi:hypothetical protein
MKREPYLWCCAAFQALLGIAGSRGISIVPRRDEQRRYFCLQARALDEESEASVLEALGKLPESAAIGRIAIVMETGIQNCPMCGKELAPLISSNEVEFERLLSTPRSGG